MEWEEPGIVLDATPYGEGDALAVLLTPRGAWRGLAKGGFARRNAGLWQKGNMVAARWVARLPEQLGVFTAELVRPVAALAMGSAEGVAVLNAACALAAEALPEREPAPESFAGLTRLLAGIDIPGFPLPELARWEIVLLRELGFGLDFSGGGGNDLLAYVSPRTGKAVTLSAAGEWVDRLLPLPGFLLDGSEPDLASCAAALRLTGHFLERAFAVRHRPLPPARARLYEGVMDRLAKEGGHAG